MKIFTFLAIVTTSLLFAQDNVESIKQKGIEYYKNNEFSSAIEEFTKIDDYKQLATIDFYLARSYYEIEIFEKALIVYERILINEPENKRVKLEIAQTYLMLKSYEIAKVSFKELLDDSSIPQSVKENINDRLKFIEEKTKKHFVGSSLMFGVGQDNNINNTTTMDSFQINVANLGLLNVQSDDKVKSSFYETALLFNHLYNLDENLSFRNSLIFYRQDFTKDNSKQLDVISLNTTPIYTNSDVSYGITFGIDNILYGDNHYLNNYSLTPKISHAIDSTKIYETSVKFLNKDFVQEIDEGNKSLIYEYQNRLILQTQDLGIFDVSLALGRENPKDKTRYDVEKEYGIVSLVNNYKISEQFTINSLLSFNNVNYRDENPLFEGKRKDDIYSLMFGLGYLYSKDLNLGLNYSYVNQDSNYVPNDYNKSVIKTTVVHDF
jgi:tetratricopeptide (TPR) repeat protein